MMHIKNSLLITSVIVFLSLQVNCSSSTKNTEKSNSMNPPVTVANEVDFWLTEGDQSVLLKKQNDVLSFLSTPNNYATIELNENNVYQTIDGFGFTLTGGSAQVINKLSATTKNKLLRELFGNEENSIGISYLRISIGASDLNSVPFTYNDIPQGELDVDLSNFSLAPDMNGVIALLKEILIIRPNIKIMGTPWSAPVWMKDNNSFIGGSLQEKYYGVYADYLVKYIQEMKGQGINIDAITPQNEPLHGGNNPSMVMTASQQADFIKNALGPAFETAGITTKIVIYDHNCDNPEYPIAILNDPNANMYVDGTAFHLYAGDISALTTVHNAFPDKNLYFTEQYTASTGEFEGDLNWHLKNVIIGSMRNWGKIALQWNLANDASFQPHTDGGCNTCKGAITVNSEGFSRNVGYYIIAHASKFVPRGSVRISSNLTGDLNNVSFKTPEGKIVLIVANNGANSELFNIKYRDKWVTTSLNSNSVGTYVWE